MLRCREREDRCEEVSLRAPVATQEATQLAAVDQDDQSAFVLEADGAHQAFAGGSAIPRVDVDVLAPQAGGTVIGVAIALHAHAAVPAVEVLDRSLEKTRQERLVGGWCSPASGQLELLPDTAIGRAATGPQLELRRNADDARIRGGALCVLGIAIDAVETVGAIREERS